MLNSLSKSAFQSYRKTSKSEVYVAAFFKNTGTENTRNVPNGRKVSKRYRRWRMFFFYFKPLMSTVAYRLKRLLKTRLILILTIRPVA